MPRVTMPLVVIKRIGCGLGLFIVYTAWNGLAGTAEAGGFLVGLGYGTRSRLVRRRPASEDRSCRRRDGGLRNDRDRVRAAASQYRRRETGNRTCDRRRGATSAAYQSALDAFKKGHMTADALAELAERTTCRHWKRWMRASRPSRNVPPEYRPLVNDAREYLRLRCQSWRLRAAAIRRTEALRGAHDRTADASSRLQAEARFRSHMVAQGNAEGAERASLDVFQRIRPNVQ